MIASFEEKNQIDFRFQFANACLTLMLVGGGMTFGARMRSAWHDVHAADGTSHQIPLNVVDG